MAKKHSNKPYAQLSFYNYKEEHTVHTWKIILVFIRGTDKTDEIKKLNQTKSDMIFSTSV